MTSDPDTSKFTISEQDLYVGEGPGQVLAARITLLVNPLIIEERLADALVDKFTYKLGTHLKNEFNRLEKTKS